MNREEYNAMHELINVSYRVINETQCVLPLAEQDLINKIYQDAIGRLEAYEVEQYRKIKGRTNDTGRAR
jgi:hypothetical protein